MIRIERMTDYAAVVLAHLRTQQQVKTSSTLAQETGIPEPTVARVLKILAAAGFVDSLRGCNGGYQARPGRTSLLDLIEAIEGKIALVACPPQGGTCCADAAQCPSMGRWSEISEDVRTLLAAHSIDTLTQRP